MDILRPLLLLSPNARAEEEASFVSLAFLSTKEPLRVDFWSHIEKPVVDFSDIPSFHNVRRFGD